jgi:hypothetical protein
LKLLKCWRISASEKHQVNGPRHQIFIFIYIREFIALTSGEAARRAKCVQKAALDGLDRRNFALMFREMNFYCMRRIVIIASFIIFGCAVDRIDGALWALA